jgi:hypothetical protein
MLIYNDLTKSVATANLSIKTDMPNVETKMENISLLKEKHTNIIAEASNDEFKSKKPKTVDLKLNNSNQAQSTQIENKDVTKTKRINTTPSTGNNLKKLKQ